MSIYKQDLRAYLTYGQPNEERRVEIISFSVTFGVQELPAANVQVAVGTDTFDGKRQPDIPVSPGPDVPTQLWLIRSLNDAGENNTSGPELVFDGFISSIAATRLSNKSAGNVTLRHKLSDLMSSSLIASYAAPGSSAELSIPAYRRWKNKSGAQGPVADGSLQAELQEDIFSLSSFDAAETDIWADIAKPFLIRVSQQNTFSSAIDFPSCFPDAGGDNNSALVALATIEGDTKDAYALTPDQYGQNLLLPIGIPASITDAIRGNLTSTKVGNLLQHTAWSYLVTRIANPFLIGMIPGIHRTRVVPMAPTLATPYIELNVDDVQVNDRNRPVDHPLLAVTMSAGTLSTSGAGGAGSVGEPFAFGPCFSPSQASPKGQVRQVGPPPWLRKVQFHAFSPDTTLQPIDGVGMGAYAATEQQAGDDGFDSQTDADATNSQKAQEIRVAVDDYAYRYVKAVYANEMTGTRSMKLVSHLRLDVGPGSQVKVVTNSDIPVFGNIAYGMVARVTIVVDVSRPFAATSFQLSHVRSEQENAVDYIGTDSHPLFRNVFKGAPLDSPI